MKNRSKFSEALRSGVSTAVGKQVGLSRVPTGEDLQEASLAYPYLIMYPFLDVSAGESMNDPEDSSDYLVRMSSVGKDPRQVGWLSDRVFYVITSRRPGGAWRYNLVGAEWSLEWRLCDQLGGILPSGPNLYVQHDTYRLRRGN